MKFIFFILAALTLIGFRNTEACEPGQACTAERHAQFQAKLEANHAERDDKYHTQMEKLDAWKAKKLETCGADQACIQKVEKIYGKKSAQLKKRFEKRAIASDKKHKTMKHEHPGKSMEHPGEEMKEHPGNEVK